MELASQTFTWNLDVIFHLDYNNWEMCPWKVSCGTSLQSGWFVGLPAISIVDGYDDREANVVQSPIL